MLRLNDRAVANLHEAQFMGTLRVGLPTDYAIGYFQRIIADFARANPEVTFDIRCDWSRNILSQLHVDELDLAIAITEACHFGFVAVGRLQANSIDVVA